MTLFGSLLIAIVFLTIFVETAMTVSEDDLYVYGGFGAEKYLSLARFSLKKQDWEIPKI